MILNFYVKPPALKTIYVLISRGERLDERFPQKVQELLKRYEILCSAIELEITKTGLVADNPTVMRVLNEFSQHGLSLPLDDFGTGYTSFNHLILYPARTLKIDRSFINDLFSSNETHAKIVETILNLAKIHVLKVSTEELETQQQLYYLNQIGCDCIQDYLLSLPVEKEALITLINTHRTPSLN